MSREKRSSRCIESMTAGVQVIKRNKEREKRKEKREKRTREWELGTGDWGKRASCFMLRIV
jgi:hypothetical protein